MKEDRGLMIACDECNYSICSELENPKEHTTMKELPLSEAGPLYSQTDRFVMRFFYCPNCATLLDIEVAQKGSGLVWNVQLKTSRS